MASQNPKICNCGKKKRECYPECTQCKKDQGKVNVSSRSDQSEEPEQKIGKKRSNFAKRQKQECKAEESCDKRVIHGYERCPFHSPNGGLNFPCCNCFGNMAILSSFLCQDCNNELERDDATR